MSLSTSKITRSARWLEIEQVRELFRSTHTKAVKFVMPAALSVATAVFEALSLGLLIPLVKGIIEMDYSFAAKLPVLGAVLSGLGVNYHAKTQIFVTLILIIFCAAVLKNLVQYLAYVLFDREVMRFSNRFRQAIFSRFLAFGKKFFDENNVGQLTNITLSFTKQIATSLRSANADVSLILMLVVYFGMMIIISPVLTVVSFLLFPLLHYTVSWIIRKLRASSRFASQYQNQLGQLLTNVIMGIPLVKGYSKEKEETKSFDAASDRLQNAEISVIKKVRLVPVIQEIVTLGAFLVLVSVMALIAARGGGEIAAFLVFFLVLRRSLQAIGSFNRIRATIADISGPLSEILVIFDDRGKAFVSEGEEVFEGLKKQIEFRKLQFSYKNDREVLKGLDLIIEKGRTTALVGKTGSGKTTVASLLMRFYDFDSGEILIDGADIRRFTFNSLHSHLALVTQDPVLFNDTLRMNMVYGAGVVLEEKLIQAAKKARLYDFIQTLPEGFETVIGDRGIQLSGGEKQRVAIARAILRGSEILILDEATSSLDSKTESLVQAAIDEAVTGKTAIVIAHRLSTIRRADKIVVIENGSVMEEGNLESLLNNQNRFSEYWKEQKFG